MQCFMDFLIALPSFYWPRGKYTKHQLLFIFLPPEILLK